MAVSADAKRLVREGVMTKTLAVVWVLGLAAPVLASSGGGEASNPFAGDIGNALWTVVIFVLVLVVLGKFAWGPILDALQKREQFIHDSLAEAKIAREAAEASMKEHEAKLAQAKAEATAIVDEGRRDAEAVRSRIEQEAKVEADKMLERAKREISLATESAVSEIYSLSGKLATDVAARVIGKELSGADHERLLNEAINDFKAVQRN